MSRLQNSDFEKLALPLLDPLYNFARWLSGNPDEARDLVQETFVKALKALGSFQEGTNFRAWMFRILRNTFLTSRTGLAHRHVGSVHAADATMALQAARDVCTRRGEGLSIMGRNAEALAELDRAHELDPTSLMVSDQKGWVFFMARRYDDSQDD